MVFFAYLNVVWQSKKQNFLDTCFIALQNDDEYIERPQVGGIGSLFRSDNVNPQSTIMLHEYAYVFTTF